MVFFIRTQLCKLCYSTISNICILSENSHKNCSPYVILMSRSKSMNEIRIKYIEEHTKDKHLYKPLQVIPITIIIVHTTKT